MEDLHYLLMKAQALFTRRILTETGKIGLTAGQPKVLECLTACGEADQKTIAAYCEIEPATVGSILGRMEAAGLVARRQREGNRRSLYVSLTEGGREAAGKVSRIFADAEAPVREGLSPEEWETLCRLLEKTCGILRDTGKKDGHA